MNKFATSSLSATMLALGLMLAGPAAAAVDGLIVAKSPHPAAETMTRLEANATQRRLKIFAMVDHAAGAATVDLELRPTAVLVFGNPKGGTPLMRCAQTVGIDLPLKALVWQDEQGQVWLGYNDPAWIVARHGAPDCPAVAPVAKALAGLAAATVAP